MTKLEFDATLDADGSLKLPAEVATQLKSVPSFHVLVLVPDDDDKEEEDWKRLGIEQFVKGYADSDSVYDDL